MMGGISSNAGLFSTANDLAKLAQLYLNGGSYGGKRYFKQSSLEFFTQRHFEANGNRRGLGFDKPRLTNKEDDAVSVLASEKSYGHSGYTGTFLWIDPEDSLVYIFFSNRVYPSRDRRKIYELNIRPRIHHALYESIQKFEEKAKSEN